MYHATCVVWLVAIGISKGINVYAENSDCGAAELKVENIDSDLREVKFSWKGQEDVTSGNIYTMKCYFSTISFDFDTPFTCTSSQISNLKRREDRWFYEFTDTDYYCAVEAKDHSSWKTMHSNIVHLRTPVASRSVVIVGSVMVVVIFVFFTIAVAIVWYRRRKNRPFVFMGILTGTSASNQPTIGAMHQQPPPPYTPPTHLPQATQPGQTYPPQAQSYQQWGEPPAYTEHKDTSQSRAPE